MTTRREFIDALLVVFCGVAVPKVVRELVHVNPNPFLYATYPPWKADFLQPPYPREAFATALSRILKKQYLPGMILDQYYVPVTHWCLAPRGLGENRPGQY